MIVEELNQRVEKIDEEIVILETEKAEILKEIEELNNQENEEETDTKIVPKKSSFIPIFMSIMSFIGILVGIFYVIYSKKGG